MKKNIAWQLSLCPVIPLVKGCLDFNEYKTQLDFIDEQLIRYDLEKELIRKCLERCEAETGTTLTGKRLQTMINHCSIALRCTIARRLHGSSFRGFHVQLAQSFALQAFVGIFAINSIRIPSKSQLERYEKFFDHQDIEDVMRQHLKHVFDEKMKIEANDGRQTLSPDHVYADSTCLPVNIHIPVDWVLLKDASLSLLKTIITIRKHGLRHRIENPKKLMKQVNKVSIQMTHARRHHDAKKKRKALFRRLKALLKRIAAHGSRYHDLLRTRWFLSDLTRNEAQCLLDRLWDILSQVEHSTWQAHERIIGARKVPNAAKILSLYEDDVHVLVRGKAGAEVEFGNGLYLAEQHQGLLVDWKLYREQPPSDSKNVIESIERMERHYGKDTLKLYCADRGFDSKKNEKYLSSRRIFNSLCPRNPLEHEIMREYGSFNESQSRRAQTEARIGIVRNVFLHGIVRSKGFTNRSLTVMWSIFTHNLWKIAQLKARSKPFEQAA